MRGRAQGPEVARSLPWGPRRSGGVAGAAALVRWGAREGSEQEFAFKGSWPVWGEQAVGSAWVLPCWKL